MEKPRQHHHLPSFVSPKKKRPVHEGSFEKYGYLVTYDRYTGKYFDFKGFYELMFRNKTISHAKRCDCTCQVELSMANVGHFVDHDYGILKKRIEDVEPRDMFYYLTGNFLQHRRYWTHEDVVVVLEKIYAKRANSAYSSPGSFDFSADSDFDRLLRQLIKKPCFRRLLASTSAGYTAARLIELCVGLDAEDVDYAAMVYRLIREDDNVVVSSRVKTVADLLHTYPRFYINRTFIFSENCMTLFDVIQPLDECRSLLGPRQVHITLPWPCKRLLFLARLKRSGKCPLSALPLDVLKIIIAFCETVSLPRARAFYLETGKTKDPTKEKRQHSKTCNLM